MRQRHNIRWFAELGASPERLGFDPSGAPRRASCTTIDPNRPTKGGLLMSKGMSMKKEKKKPKKKR